VREQDLIFFVHVMKVGGTSLNWMLRRIIPRELSYPDAEGAARFRPYMSIADLQALSQERKARIRYLTGHFPFCVGELFDRPVRHIAFLRDPVERVLSFLRATHMRLPEQGRPTLQALYDDDDRRQRYLDNLQTRVFAWNLEDGMETVFDPRPLSGSDLERAKARLESCEVIGLQEDYGTSFELVKRHFGLSFKGHPRANVSDSHEAPSSLREQIARDCDLDRALYAHAEHLYRSRLADEETGSG
jgi:hypothetical protein